MNKEQFIALGLTDEQATKAAGASQEELKGFIPKTRFDEVNEAKKQLETTVNQHKTQLETLKTTAGDAEALKTQIAQLQGENQAAKEKYDNDMKDITLSNAIKLALTGKVHDESIVTGLVDKTKLIVGTDGKIVGLDEQLTTLKEGKAFLFKLDEAANGNPPPAGFQKVGNPPPNNPQVANAAISAAFGNVTQTK